MAVSGNPAIETVWLRWVPGVCPQKFPLKKPQSKNSTVSDREFDSLSDTVQFFDLQIFSLCELLWVIYSREFVKATVNTAKYAETLYWPYF